MSAMTNILVKDDASTRKEFTMLPIADSPSSIWRASEAGVPVDGQVRMTLHNVERIKSGYKHSYKVEVPVLETLGASGTSAGYVAPPKVAYVTTGVFTMFSDVRATNADRANCLSIVLGGLQGASATTATGILSQTSAGSAFSATALPIPNAIVNLINPN